MFKIVRRYYKKGYYSKDDVKVFVKVGDLTPEQYKQITGDDYIEDEE